jgi:hypothetical protein
LPIVGIQLDSRPAGAFGPTYRSTLRTETRTVQRIDETPSPAVVHRQRPELLLIDDEAVVLGVDGISDFEALCSRNMMQRCSSTPSTFSRSTIASETVALTFDPSETAVTALRAV